MNKKTILFKKQNGIIFGAIAWIIAFCSFTIAISLFKKVDPSYSIFTHYLSDLGAGENFSNVILFIGLVLTETFQIPFYMSLGLKLKQKNGNWKLIRIALGASIISCISLIIVIPFLSDPEKLIFNIMHGILGGMHFGSMAIAFLFYGIIELSNRSIPKIFAIISFSSGSLYGLNSLSFNIYIIYWLAIGAIFLWIFVHIIFLIRLKK